MLSDLRPQRSPTLPIPAVRSLHPGEEGYPLADGTWQSWPGGPALFARQDPPPPISAIGSLAVLHRPRLGLICSSHCPGSIALATYRVARCALPGGPLVIGGFHSPMERTVFELLTTRHCPVVVCPGRRIRSHSVPAAWAAAIAEERLLILSPFTPERRRVDRLLAQRRNAFVAALADTVFVPYARPGGAVASLVMTLLEEGRTVITVADRETEGLVVLGARAVSTEGLIAMVRGAGESGGDKTQDPGLLAGIL